MSQHDTSLALELAAIRAGEEFDERAVLDFLASRAEELCLDETPTSLQVLQFPGGRANLTYLVTLGQREFVLRRPPMGQVGPGAHDMGREFRILSRLWQIYDRAPRAFSYCDDKSLIGAAFFVMERRKGTVIRYDIPEVMKMHSGVERRVSFALVDALVDLHKADYESVGLGDMGNPNGFLERQLAGWKKRWELSRTDDILDFERLATRLESNLPKNARISMIHNDPKLDNCQFDSANPDRVTSMFDWDMATIGHSLVDLGTLLAYWSEAQAQAQGFALSALSIFAKPGFPSREEIAVYYAEQSGASLEEISWYESFALWKSAVVAQQVFARYHRGQTTDERFARMGERVPGLLAAGLQRAYS